jgi:hypothetical protein
MLTTMTPMSHGSEGIFCRILVLSGERGREEAILLEGSHMAMGWGAGVLGKGSGGHGRKVESLGST